MVATGLNVRTKVIGDELARLIRTNSGSFGPNLKICQFGDVELMVPVPALRTMLPAVWVKPSTTEQEAFDLAGLVVDVTESFRIAFAYSVEGATANVLDTVSDSLDSILSSLSDDRTLSELTLGGKDQMVSSDGTGIEWDDSPEDLFLADNAIPVKVAVILWQVQWRAV